MKKQNKTMDLIQNKHRASELPTHEAEHFSNEKLEKSIHFHSSLPGYKATPLERLDNLAKHLNVGAIYVKDESKRFGLNAFKGLGGIFAIASYFARKLDLDLSKTDFQKLVDRASSLPKVTFATVTSGNHGRGVAWAAKLFNQHARIYLPKGSSTSRSDAIKEYGAEAYLSELNYDDTVLRVAKMAAKNDWVLLQDTAWEGYEEIPLDIMQGYTTIVSEIVDQLGSEPLHNITHVFLQAGVGSFAAAIAGAIYQLYPKKSPKIIIVEPRDAGCFYQSALDDSGKPQRVQGKLDTMMAGLACGEPNPLAWMILKSISDYFILADDTISAKGMKILGNPLDDDAKIISGESGAIPIGVVHEILSHPKNRQIQNELQLDKTSKILVINTEGDTDPDNYHKIVNHP